MLAMELLRFIRMVLVMILGKKGLQRSLCGRLQKKRVLSIFQRRQLFK